MNCLVFPDDSLKNLRESLLSTNLERAAVILARPVRVMPDSWRLLAFDTMVVPDAAYDNQSSSRVEIPPYVLAPAVKRARYEHASIVLAHTHPWNGVARPSHIDLYGEQLLVPALATRVPNVPHARLIISHNDTHAALIAGGDETPLDVLSIGRTLQRAPEHLSGEHAHAAFDRQVRALGEHGQRLLGSLRVAIVGVGGTGSIVAQHLAHLGVRRFLLVDPDVLEESNLNRVVGGTRSHIGRAKVAVAQDVVSAIRPDAEVVTVQDDIARQSIARMLLATDLFFCCTDSQGSRAVLNQLCYQYFLPGIDIGVSIEVRDGAVKHVVGRVQMLAPGLACMICTGLLDPETVRRELLTAEQRRADPYILGGPIEPQPSVMPFNSAVVGWAMTMFLGVVTGAPFHIRHQILRFDSGTVRQIDDSPDPDCSLCGRSAFLGRGDSWPMPGRPG